MLNCPELSMLLDAYPRSENAMPELEYEAGVSRAIAMKHKDGAVRATFTLFVEEFPRTETFRIRKGGLKTTGVTPDTLDMGAA
ncbi:MAG TPA: hypothetical protein PKM41_08300 [Deltaproteobacteria bacterium]|jgi:hypothetical protein|nr:hypothetical protein [Deltaproteobacteria bacterium]HOI07636.1 hypothetical protein [Deltaproteobacteria bacterium]